MVSHNTVRSVWDVSVATQPKRLAVGRGHCKSAAQDGEESVEAKYRYGLRGSAAV